MQISILGLGIIGQAWARNLISDGLAITTWNRTPKDFPGFVADLSQIVAKSEILIVVVSDPPAVTAILDQVIPHLRSGQIFVQCSTVSSQWTKTFFDRVTATGAQFLEAPFTGSKPAAESRQTVYYIGGETNVLDLAKPVLNRLSKAILHIGPIGSASSLKLAMNMNIAMVMQALSESLMFSRREGLKDEVFFQALGLNVSHSGVADLKAPMLRSGNFAPQFSLKHMYKDLNLALESAHPFSLPQLQALKAVYDRGLEAGLGEEDFSVLIQLLQR
jgi:3-hydroxyisobutyrate dehydrogenase-like beta-hydroxyacid dehydrogenase